jgi:hypothetical protein
MSLHFHDSLFADFSFAQGKSIRCLCFAQLRTSFRLAANCSSSVGTYPVSAGHRIATPFKQREPAFWLTD